MPTAEDILAEVAEVALRSLRTFRLAESLFCEVAFEDGTVGFGQCGNKDVEATEDVLFRRVVPALFHGRPLTLGENAAGLVSTSRLYRAGRGEPEDARRLSPLMERVVGFELNYKCMGVQLSKAVAGVDAAVWDALARRLEYRVCDLWQVLFDPPRALQAKAAAGTASIPVYASSIARTDDTVLLCGKLAELNRRHGIRAFKVKVGERMGGLRQSTPKDFERAKVHVANVFDGLSAALKHDKFRLAFDCNGGFSNTEGLDELRGDVWFVEEPVPWFQSTVQQQKSKFKLAGGEQEFRMDILHHTIGLFDIFQLDFGYSGGPSHLILAWLWSLTHGHLVIFPHSPQPDMHPLYALHFCLFEKQADVRKEVFLELACVDDGLKQVDLGTDGFFKPKFAQSPLFQVTNGEAHFVESSSSRTSFGWGMQVNWTDIEQAAVSTRKADSTSVNTKRSFL